MTDAPRSTPVVDTTGSPFARQHPASVAAVMIDDAFWAPRIRTNRDVTIPSQHRLLEETGRLENLRWAAGKHDRGFEGRYFNDSDVYKWLEGAAWTLASGPNDVIARLTDQVIGDIEAAQRPDGYLNSYFSRDRADQRWTDLDLHELYCAGHLFQAAVAHHRATGSTRLLDVATRFADHICDLFGPAESGKRTWSDGHPEVEMALVELFRETGERRYLDQAAYFINIRGHQHFGNPYHRHGPEYHQDHLPIREMDEVVGHAVRAIYFNTGAADLWLETGEPALGHALNRLWLNMTARKMHISGGLGARYDGEAFGEDFELPNARAYTETCAAIASVMWNWRMLLATNEARYADVMELALYNSVLSGLSLDGQSYFYQNPLADDGGHRRQAWFGTACCPPNLARLLPSLGGYIYSVGDDDVWVHLYAEGMARLTLPGGRTVELRQTTRYPWDGEIEIAVACVGDLTLHLRVPAWCEHGATVEVNGARVELPLSPGSYAEIRRTWSPGDIVRLRLPMPVRRVECNPMVEHDAGRVALMRGPLLYCLEGVDNPQVDLRQLAIPGTGDIDATFRPELLGGVIALSLSGTVPADAAPWDGKLYRTLSATERGDNAVHVTAIPYHVWANREAGPMQVWLNLDR